MVNISGKTRLLCLIGDPVSHSFSPAMHNAVIQHLDMDYVYVSFSVKKDCLKDAIAGMRALGIIGANVTIPHKVEVMQYLDVVDEKSKIIGAVNTILFKGRKGFGYNTDYQGFVDSLKEKGFCFKKKSVCIFGAGGAARAVACACAMEGMASISVVNRDIERAKSLVSHLENFFPEVDYDALPLDVNKIRDVVFCSDILVNATPVGMYNDASIIPQTLIKPSSIVYDLIYNPPLTPFLRGARNIGASIINGIDMLVHQGAKSFEIWTNVSPPISVMKKALLSCLGVDDAF